MTESEHSPIKSVLNCFVSARKCIQFYPANNPRVTDHLETFVESLNQYFFSTLSRSEEKNATLSLVIVVARDAFQVNGETISDANETMQKCASQLYRLGIKLICITPGADMEEFRTFFSALNETPENMRNHGGLTKLIDQLGLEHILVEQAALLDLVSESKSADEADILDYLKRKQADRRARESVASASELIEEWGTDGAQAISDLADFFLDIAQGSVEMRERLMNTLGNPEKLAATLSAISQARQPSSSSSGSSVSVDVLRRALRGIADSLGSLPEETRNEYLRKMADAVMLVDPDTQEQLTDEAFAASIGQGNVEEEILTFLSDETVADVLSKHVVFHGGTSGSVLGFLNQFAHDESRQAAIRGMIANNLLATNDDRFQGIADMLSHDLTPEQLSEAREAIPESVSEEQQRLAQELLLEQMEKNTLSQQLHVACQESEYEYAAKLILYLQVEHHVHMMTEKMAEVVETGLAKAFDSNNFEEVSLILRYTAGERSKNAAQGDGSVYDRILEVGARPEYFDRLVNVLRGIEKDDPAYEQYAGILRCLGDKVATALFQRMSAEENRSLRMFVVGLFVEMDEQVVPFLLSKIGHPEWFVVRNVVYMLGRIGSEKALDNLRNTLRHPDSRVRIETVKALGSIRGTKAENLLISCIKDPDPLVAQAALEWVNNLHLARALPVLLTLMKVRKKDLHEKPELALPLIHAIGHLGGPDEIPALRDFSPGRWMFFSKDAKELIKACDESIESIHERAKSHGTA